MPEPVPDRENEREVDFVVGSADSHAQAHPGADDDPAERRIRLTGWRLRLSLAGGAAVLALGTLIAQASSHQRDPAPSPSPPSSSLSSSAAVDDSPQPVVNPFQLATRTAAAGDCPFGTTCSWSRTSPKALAAVRTVFAGAKIRSSQTRLGVSNGRFGPTLLSRFIVARLPVGNLAVTVSKPTNGDTRTTRHDVEPKITVITVVELTGGYVVTTQLTERTGRTDPDTLLQKLAYDPRLLAIR